MEREFPLRILENQVGRIHMSWDGLRIRFRATAQGVGTGICKLSAVGEEGECLLGTMMPEHGTLTLERSLPITQLRQAGAWPVSGVAVTLLYPRDCHSPFPLPALFCFAREAGEMLRFPFESNGMPKRTDERGNKGED